MEQSEPNNALGLHFQLETKNQKDNQLGVAESMSYSQFSMSCKNHQPKKTHWNFPWQFSLNKMQKTHKKEPIFEEEKRLTSQQRGERKPNDRHCWCQARHCSLPR